MFGTTTGNRRKFLTVIGGVLVMLMVAGLAAAFLRERPVPLSAAQPATKSDLPVEAQRPAEKKPVTKEKPVSNEKPVTNENPVTVLVWIESTPPGARIVRISDNFILGRTPEIVGFSQSTEPVPVRFEMEGYVPVTRDVAADKDGSFAVVLKPSAQKHARRSP